MRMPTLARTAWETPRGDAVAREGDGAATAVVELEGRLEAIAPRLLRYCKGLLQDASLAEEIAQESLAALVKAWRSAHPPDNPDAFVFAIARRRTYRALFRRRLLVPIQFLTERRDARPDPEQRVLANERHKQVLAAVGRLSRSEREALLLVAACGHKVEDAARLLGISPSAVKMRMLRARRNLVALLDKHHER